VRDQVFSGQDVDDALAVAAATLGLPRAELRYVVLDAGSPAARGLKPTPARIAVMLEPDRTGVEGAH
jgi:predicted RNA-binding protein Jag